MSSISMVNKTIAPIPERIRFTIRTKQVSLKCMFSLPISSRLFAWCHLRLHKFVSDVMYRVAIKNEAAGALFRLPMICDDDAMLYFKLFFFAVQVLRTPLKVAHFIDAWLGEPSGRGQCHYSTRIQHVWWEQQACKYQRILDVATLRALWPNRYTQRLMIIVQVKRRKQKVAQLLTVYQWHRIKQNTADTLQNKPFFILSLLQDLLHSKDNTSY